MLKMILLNFLLLIVVRVAAQEENTGVSEMKGILIFEGHDDLYFIKTDHTDLLELLRKNKDTLVADMLYFRDGAYNYKNYLDQQLKFDSTMLLITQANYEGRLYKSLMSMYWSYGTVKYFKERSYKLAVRFKDIVIDNKIVVVKLENYVTLEEFEKKSGKND